MIIFRLFFDNFEIFNTSNIVVIVIMPIFWLFQSSRNNRIQSATVKRFFKSHIFLHNRTLTEHDGLKNVHHIEIFHHDLVETETENKNFNILVRQVIP